MTTQIIDKKKPCKGLNRAAPGLVGVKERRIKEANDTFKNV